MTSHSDDDDAGRYGRRDDPAGSGDFDDDDLTNDDADPGSASLDDDDDIELGPEDYDSPDDIRQR